MNWNTVLPGGFAVAVGLIAVAREWASSRGARSRIKQDIDLLGLLPDDSAARDALRTHVDRSISRLIETEQELRRDPSGIALAVFFAMVSVWTVAQAISGSDVWWLATGVAGLFTLAGFAVAVPKVRRDDRGRAIKEDRSP